MQQVIDALHKHHRAALSQLACIHADLNRKDTTQTSHNLLDKLATSTHVRDESVRRLDDGHNASRIFIIVMLEPVAVLAQLVPVVCDRNARVKLIGSGWAAHHGG